MPELVAGSGIRLVQPSPPDGDVTAERDLTGFGDYNDLATFSTPINLAAETWTAVTNDGAGAFTNKSYLPTGATDLMDVTTGQFDFSELALGDVVLIRNDFTVNPNVNNSLLSVRYKLGTGAGEYTLEKIQQRLDDGSGKGYRFSLEVDLIYMGDANTRDNLGTLEIKLSGAGTVTNAGSAIVGVKR